MTANDKPPRRHARRLTAVLLIVGWFAFLGVGGGYAGMLGEVVRNDNAAFLPADAEATQVAEVEPDFFGGEQIPAVIVYARDSGITDADRRPSRATCCSSRAWTAWRAGRPGPSRPPTGARSRSSCR
jgi:hypothetical protein